MVSSVVDRIESHFEEVKMSKWSSKALISSPAAKKIGSKQKDRLLRISSLILCICLLKEVSSNETVNVCKILQPEVDGTLTKFGNVPELSTNRTRCWT